MANEASEPLFSKKNKVVFKDPLIENNPIAVQVLGICSALAVTTQLKPSLIMAFSVIFVLTSSNVVLSLIRNFIPMKIRMIVELCVIASLVILVDQVLQAYAYGVSKQLSVFVGLIITNCIVMGRAEAFALSNKPWPSLLDGLGNGLGYGLILVIIGIAREVLGQGTIWGYPLTEFLQANFGYVNNGLMVLPPGAFIILGFIVWIQRQITGNFEEN